jgi:LuxR family maltose regulon positive regulatory protein
VYVALGRAVARAGELAAAEEYLGRALEVLTIDGMLVQRAQALLVLASVRHIRSDLPGARLLVKQARELLAEAADPGMLPALLERTERTLGSAPRRQAQPAEPITDRELAVLRLLPTGLSQREIGRELYVSVNTVRTHTQSIYRKLDVATRAEAVTRARELGLVPGSTAPSSRSE